MRFAPGLLVPWLLTFAAVILLSQACAESASVEEEQSSPGNENLSADSGAPPTDEPLIEPYLQNSGEAATEDAALIAEANGWTPEQVAIHLRASEVIGEIAAQVAASRPDAFVGGALAEEPTVPPMLYIKGPADDYVLGLIAGAGIGIVVIDGQPYSFAELEARKVLVSDHLRALGFENYSVGFRVGERGAITAAVTTQPGLPDDPDAILASLPDDLRDSVRLTMSDDPIVVDN